ncbi:YceI family protein [Parafilimonas sp.]|uniref:YceI family protein n=1 Tax=Parafilimonas sp. TaxID=1969739 RepID=UPI0039E6B50D
MNKYLPALKSLLITVLAGAFLLFPLIVSAQEKFTAQSVNISITGTSTLHDWEEKSSQGQCTASIAVKDNKIDIAALRFSTPAKGLKSEHTLMDKNTYKALNADKYPAISFVLSSATAVSSGSNTYQLKATGSLTLAGTTKQTDINATLVYNPASKSFTCKGSKTIKMSEYGVTPPTVMMGTIKTGDQVTITYELIIRS